jgi:phosphoglycerate kinase
MELRGVERAEVESRTVLARVDYNVPLSDGRVSDDTRLRASLPTIEYLLERGAKVVLLSHLGRPEGHVVEALSLAPVATALSDLLGRPVRLLPDCVGQEVSQAIEAGAPGDVFLLENVRFHREETTNESAFARALSMLGDVYVNDAFATVHRAHASTVGIADHLPAYAGFLMEREIGALSRLESPERPYLAIVGGKKARSKLGALRDLVSRVDEILIGGGVAFTFLRALGADVGDSIVDEELLDEIREIQDAALRERTTIHLPEDVVIATDLSATDDVRTCDARSIPAGWQGLDIGPNTVERFSERIRVAKTLVWTGPLGAFEIEPFSAGTREIGEAVADSDAFSVIGGGETGEAVALLGLAERVSYISTGGGACLALLRGKHLPALEALMP